MTRAYVCACGRDFGKSRFPQNALSGHQTHCPAWKAKRQARVQAIAALEDGAPPAAEPALPAFVAPISEPEPPPPAAPSPAPPPVPPVAPVASVPAAPPVPEPPPPADTHTYISRMPLPDPNNPGAAVRLDGDTPPPAGEPAAATPAAPASGAGSAPGAAPAQSATDSAMSGLTLELVHYFFEKWLPPELTKSEKEMLARVWRWVLPEWAGLGTVLVVLVGPRVFIQPWFRALVAWIRGGPTQRALPAPAAPAAPASPPAATPAAPPTKRADQVKAEWDAVDPPKTPEATA